VARAKPVTLDHLMKLKKQWEEVQYFCKELNRKSFDDSFLKQQIVVSLPCSWDNFTSNYVKSFVDDDDADVDAKKHIDSNELIGTITQEYNLTNPHKTEKSSSPPKGENSRSSLADWMDNQNSNSTSGFYEGKRKKQCHHCSLTGHLVSQCKFLRQNRCRKCNHFRHDADQCLQPQMQSSDLKRKGNYTTGNSSKCARTEVQNTKTEGGSSQSANVAVHDEQNEAEDGPIDVLSDAESEIISPCVRSQNNKPFDLYDWLADTGTTSHITHRRDAFAMYELILKLKVSGIGGVQSFVIARGTVFLQAECDGTRCTLQLHNVLHIPENSNNLLSLRCWEQQSGRSIVIKYGKLELLTKDDIVIARGICLTNNLYQISLQLLKAPVNADFAFLACKDMILWEDWHKIFGHVSYSSLQ